MGPRVRFTARCDESVGSQAAGGPRRPPPTASAIGTQGTCTRVRPDAACAAAWRAQKPTSACARAKQEVAGRRPTWRLHPRVRARPARVCTHTQVQPLRVRRCGAARLPGGRLAHAHTRTYVCTHDHAAAAPCVGFFACTRVYPGASPVFPRWGRGALPLSHTAQWMQDPAKFPPPLPPPETNPGCFPPGLPCKRAFSGPRWGGPALHTPPAEQPSQIWGCSKSPLRWLRLGGARLPPANPRAVEGAVTAPGERRLWQLMQRRASEFFSGKHGF